ncbi:translocation/assembly module TamB domain-containing protein [Candidatus Nitrosacidococcus tergens]|uniref:Translocation and assembly module TamB C-terminal domain-containing protein n=1 Tax=Candidatus Nitrosacidococcus tergens TaxID=553981 RepID=A0A7G1Q7N8_9GAMM|nr:translocation/assembly module TamB domain-containing protein [Candidatus Nitrosacidococcus tergens]CAB1274646.1 conserved protein of unknown function [Candidatus Nitrosacidococcus tergens]
MKLVKKLSFLILFSFLLAIGSITYLVATETGTKWLFTQISNQTSGIFQIGKIEGSLANKLTLTEVNYFSSDFDLTIEQLVFAWNPAMLLETTFWIDKLWVKSIRWHQTHSNPPSNHSSENITLPQIKLPLKIVIRDAQAKNIKIEPLKSPPQLINTVALKGKFEQQSLKLNTLYLSTHQGHIKTSGIIAPQKNYPLNLRAQWGISIPDVGEIIGKDALRGNLEQLTIYQTTQSPFQSQLKGRLSDPLHNLGWIAALEISEVELQKFLPQTPEARLSLHLKSAGNLNKFKVQASFQAAGSEFGHVQGALKGEQQSKGHWIIDQLDLDQKETQGYFTLYGHIVSQGDQPQVAVQGHWQDLAWPLMEEAKFASKEGDLNLQGVPDNYHLTVNTVLSGQEIPKSQWSLDGVGNTKQFNINPLVGKLLSGTVTTQGQITWKPNINWDLNITSQEINPGIQWVEWPGSLNFKIDTQGILQDSNQRNAIVKIQDFSGSLRNYPIHAQGQVQVENMLLTLKEVALYSGDSNLSATGTVGEHLDLNWQLISQDLSQLLPEAKGNITAKGYLGGYPTFPEVILKLQGSQLKYQNFQLGKINADGNIDPTGKQQSKLLVEAKNIYAADEAIQSLVLQGGGIPQKHRLNVNLNSTDRSLDLSFLGAWNEDKFLWQGQIYQGQITDSLIGRWNTVKPTSLILNNQIAQLAPWCWQQEKAQLCLNGNWQQNKPWDARFNITDLSLATFTSFLPKHTSIVGTIEGFTSIKGIKSQLMYASGHFVASPGEIIQTNPEEEKLTFIHRGLTTKLNLKEGQGEVSLKLLLDEPSASPINAVFHLPPAPIDFSSFNKLPLDGKIFMAFTDLAFLETLIPEVEEIHGQFNVDLSLKGNLVSPEILGQAILKEGTAQIDNLDLELTNLHLQLDAQGKNLLLNGGVTSGEGQLALTGQSYLDTDNLRARLNISGNRFEAMNTPEIHALISPNLNLRLQDKEIYVDGEVLVPQANIIIKDIKTRGGIAGSRDVVIVSKKENLEEKLENMPIYAKVRAILGDRVVVQGFGFKGEIAGNLLVTDAPGTFTQANGQINLTNQSQYKAYGQELEIRRGLLIFSGPIDKPQLNVEAVRIIDSDRVTAGIRIHGPATAPEPTLFSEPPMNQSDILSYLVMGRPLSNGSNAGLDRSQLMEKTATSLGLAGGGFLAKGLSKITGLDKLGIIDDIGVENTMPGENQSAAFMLGKHISPRLYIGYGVGILERFNAFRIRYTLNRLLRLQAETGIESGGDLLFDLER